ncbi:MAG: SDR family oxidoreductase [Desulfatibacillaceae bacterium]
MNVLLLGGNSDIGWALAVRFAREDRAGVVLAGRDMDVLDKKARDLELRYGVAARAVAFDAVDTDSHGDFWESLDPKPDGVVYLVGQLGDQERAQRDFAHAREIIESNYLGAVSILEIAAADLERRETGFIIGVSSVAGERGRGSNYIYGSAKAAFTAYLSGLRNRLFSSGVHVMTVLPGFVRTKMTVGLGLSGPLLAEPEQVADDVHGALVRKKDVVYTKWVWRFVMMVIKSIPERLFKRTNL